MAGHELAGLHGPAGEGNRLAARQEQLEQWAWSSPDWKRQSIFE
jgi:hypothetical protein